MILQNRPPFFPVIIAALLLAAAAIAPAADLNSTDAWPFIHPQDTFQSSALLDLRSLNESVAGQTGFVHLSSDGGFLRGDGTPIRFWACGTGEYTKDSDELGRHARFLAKLGVNMVRLHAQICSADKDSALTDVNQKEIDGIWRAVAAFKKEGIYVTISPYWAADKQATHWGIAGYESRTDLWGLLFFNETLQNGYKAWVKALYAKPNPYTGIPLSQDPAVAIIQVQNEDGMFFWTMQGLKPPQKIELGRKFARWLIAKYGRLDDAARAWEDASAPGDNFDAGQVGILLVWEWTQPQHGGKARRLADQLQFFADTQRGFYADMARYYHDDLGCKQLINASNWTTADAVRLNDVERFTDTADDVLAVNRYFTGIHDGPQKGWRIDPGDFFTNNPAVLNPRDLPINLKQVVGHPMIVTESSWVNPLDFQSEGPFLIAAYESLTGVAGYDWFMATSEQYETDPYFDFLNIKGQHPFRKWTCSTPALMGNFPAAALLYRKGYVHRGQPVIVEQRSLDDLWNRRLPLIAEGTGFDPNRMSGDRAAPSNLTTSADPLAFLVGPVLVHYGGDAAQSRVMDISSYIDRTRKIIKSDTGQIQLNYDIGLCTLDAPAAQGVSGFLAKAGPLKLSTITLSSTNDHATILVVSMDGLALNESHQILVQIGTRVRPTGWIDEPADFQGQDKAKYHGFKIVNTGKLPFLIADADATLTIDNPHLAHATVLDASGYPAGEIPLTANGKSKKLVLPPRAMYVILR